MKHLIIKLSLIVLMSMTSNNMYSFSAKNNQGITINYNYINDNEELEVVRTNGYNTYSDYTDIIIPEEVTYMGRTRKVTSIADYTFYNCKKLTSIGLPKSLKSIGKLAFWQCSRLKRVIINDIAAWCNIDFFDLEYSNPLNFAHHLYSDENTEIKELVIPNDVTIIKNYAFRKCYGITSIKIPNSVTKIGVKTFEDCTGLQKVIVNDIAAWCNIKLEDYWNSNPLQYAHHLYSDENTEIKELVIPNSIMTIRDGSFYGCSGLTSLKLSNSVTTIGNNAFQGCSGLTSIMFSNNLTTIGKYAFEGCYNLTSINIPNSVITIEEEAFQSCYNLTSITIPNSIITIGYNAFYLYYVHNNDKPVEIISLIEEPKNISENVFSIDLYTNATLFVPKGTIDKYKACNGWGKFVYIEEIPETNNIANIPAKAVMIQTEGSTIKVQGCDDGEQIAVYNTNGIKIGSSISVNEYAVINTTLQPGSLSIVKIGKKTIKVLIK